MTNKITKRELFETAINRADPLRGLGFVDTYRQLAAAAQEAGLLETDRKPYTSGETEPAKKRSDDTVVVKWYLSDAEIAAINRKRDGIFHDLSINSFFPEFRDGVKREDAHVFTAGTCCKEPPRPFTGKPDHFAPKTGLPEFMFAPVGGIDRKPRDDWKTSATFIHTQRLRDRDYFRMLAADLATGYPALNANLSQRADLIKEVVELLQKVSDEKGKACAEKTALAGVKLEPGAINCIMPYYSKAAYDVIKERSRQVSHEGFTHTDDKLYGNNELIQAAQAYASTAVAHSKPNPTNLFHYIKSSWWPRNWRADMFKPKDKRKDLVRAAALLVAAIEKHDREGK